MNKNCLILLGTSILMVPTTVEVQEYNKLLIKEGKVGCMYAMKTGDFSARSCICL